MMVDRQKKKDTILSCYNIYEKRREKKGFVQEEKEEL
jgi:hypothetical protein